VHKKEVKNEKKNGIIEEQKPYIYLNQSPMQSCWWCWL